MKKLFTAALLIASISMISPSFAATAKYGGATRTTADSISSERSRQSSETEIDDGASVEENAKKIEEARAKAKARGSRAQAQEAKPAAKAQTANESEVRAPEYRDSPMHRRATGSGVKKKSSETPSVETVKETAKKTESETKKVAASKPEADENILKISYVRPRYLAADETRTTAEIFTGDEYTHGKLTIRSNPNKRAGMYFFVMLEPYFEDILLAHSFELTVVSSDLPHPRTYVFEVPETHSTLREVKLALTGDDWVGAKTRVNAWKLTLKDPLGKVLDEKKSWLWSIKDSE